MTGAEPFSQDRKKFVQGMKRLLVKLTGCDIQHNGWPCNSCFHTAMGDMGFDDDLSHEFWQFVLSIRGDYSAEEIKKSRGEMDGEF